MSNNDIFISTQIQGQLDDWALESSLLSKLGTLRSQYLQSPSTVEKLPRKQRKTVTKRKLGLKSDRVKSITSHVTKAHKDKQKSVLEVLSGKKRKVKEIIQRIASIEELSSLETVDQVPLKDPSTIYNEEEWVDIVRNINIHFPTLSRSSKLTISRITRKYLQFDNDGTSDEDKNGEKKLSLLSLWQMAATPPVSRLTNDELRWLYDISDDEETSKMNVESSFVDGEFDNVLNLSQVLRSTKYDDEIPNSSPEPEELVCKRKIKTTNPDSKRAKVDNQVLPVIEEISSGDEQPESKRSPIRYSQLDPVTISSSSFPDTGNKLSQKSVTSLKDKFSPMNGDLAGSLRLQTVDSDAHDLIESSPFPHSLGSFIANRDNFLDDNEQDPAIDQLPNSMFPKMLPYKDKYDEVDQNPSFQTVYSTAQSDIYYTQLPDAVSKLRTETRYANPVEITVRGRLAQSDPHQILIKRHKEAHESDTELITTRVVSCKPHVADDDEVPNSSSDEEDLSVIEILREVKHDNSRTIEVPSSQKQATSPPDTASGIDLSNVLPVESESTDEVVTDYSKFTNEELKTQLNSWGLKVKKSRARMIETLTQASLLISQSQKVQRNSQLLSQNSVLVSQGDNVKHFIFERVTRLIKQKIPLYDKIILYEPISMTELQQNLQDANVDIEPYLIREYCDSKGVTLVGGDNEKDVDMQGDSQLD